MSDPHQIYNKDGFESMQGFAPKLATRKWSENAAALCRNLSWPSIASRRSHRKLCLCCCIISDCSIILSSVSVPLPPTSCRHMNSCPIFIPCASTNYYSSSYFISAIPLWNTLPESIISLSSAFKRHLGLLSEG